MGALTAIQLILLIGAAFFIGFSKTAISGATLPAIAMVAYTFGGKQSSGIMLTMLIVADVIGVSYYGRYVKFRDVLVTMPYAILGIILGALVGNSLDDAQFKLLLGMVVMLCLILLIYMEFAGKEVSVPSNLFVYILVGVVCGFSSMVGNAAGPIFSVYLLGRGFEKNRFIATVGWFFFIVNLIKLPFQVFMWHTITFSTLQYTLYMMPVIFFGAIFGILVVKRINERVFKNLVIVMTVIVAVRLML